MQEAFPFAEHIQGFMCNTCGFCCRSMSTLARHMRQSKDSCSGHQVVATQQLFAFGVLKGFLKIKNLLPDAHPNNIEMAAQWDAIKLMKGNADVNQFDAKNIFQSWTTALIRAHVDGEPSLLISSCKVEVIPEGLSAGLQSYMECKH